MNKPFLAYFLRAQVRCNLCEAHPLQRGGPDSCENLGRLGSADIGVPPWSAGVRAEESNFRRLANASLERRVPAVRSWDDQSIGPSQPPLALHTPRR